MNDYFVFSLVERLALQHGLTLAEYEQLISQRTPEVTAALREKAVAVRKEIYGNAVYTRGLIEFTNVCKNDCFYCGIRRSNPHCSRYRLSPEEIFACCEEGYRLNFRTFVLQGGDDGAFSDALLCDLGGPIKQT